MPEISLTVTKRVLEHAKGPHEAERQIAYKDASPDIAPRLAEVTRQHQMKVKLGGQITLVVGDRGAIWQAHNKQYSNDFDALFTFLAHYPSKPMRFLCEIAE